MNQFYPLKIKQLEKTTEDCTVLSFDVPEQLKGIFAFQHGQHLTLKTNIQGEEIRRNYSLCSSPIDKEWKVAVKKIEGGLFSTFVNQELKQGDTLDVMHPNGSFFVAPKPDEALHYVAFAAGSGITPVFSILKTHLLMEPKCRFTLFYTNQTVSSIILKEEIEAFKNQFLDRFEPYFFLTQEERDVNLFNGRMDESKLDKIGQYLLDYRSADAYFLCGPEEMILMIRDYLQNLGVDSDKIHFELFHSAIGEARKIERKQKQTISGMASVVLKEGGKTVKFSMPKGQEPILDVALKYNTGLPFACKGGVCCTCKAKLVEGKVEMDVNYALEKEQLEAGYILTCQAIPVSDAVLVDFDQ